MLAELERLGCPVLTTYQAMGVVPEGHPQQAGLYTSGSIEAAVIEQADLVIAVGLDQVEPMPFPWRYDVPVVSVSEVPASATLVPITVEVLGPLVTTLQRVLGVVRHRFEWRADSAGATLFGEARSRSAATSAGRFGPLELVDCRPERLRRKAPP